MNVLSVRAVMHREKFFHLHSGGDKQRHPNTFAVVLKHGDVISLGMAKIMHPKIYRHTGFTGYLKLHRKSGIISP